MINLLQGELKRGVFSRSFLISCLGITVLLFTAVGGMLGMESYHSVWYFMSLALQGSGMASTILTILPVLAYGLSYAKEVEENSSCFFIIRSGITRYSLVKVIIAGTVGFLVVFLGLLLFILLLWTRYPFFIHVTGDGPYDLLIEQGDTLKGVFFYLTHQGLVGALVSVSAICFSSFIPNAFTTTAAPMIIYFSLLRITSSMKLPMVIDPLYWVAAMYTAEVSATESLLMKGAVIMILCLILGTITVWRIRRRVLNG